MIGIYSSDLVPAAFSPTLAKIAQGWGTLGRNGANKKAKDDIPLTEEHSAL
jgi:hypothetical protein